MRPGHVELVVEALVADLQLAAGCAAVQEALGLAAQADRHGPAFDVVDGDAPSVRGGVLFGGDSRFASIDNVVERNVIAYAQSHNIESTWGGAVGTGNIARNNCLWAGRDGDIGSGGGFSAIDNLVALPLFVDRMARDYRLAPGSLCLSVVGLGVGG